MYLLPAIDILEGHAVRLAKGDYSQVTVYNDDPVDQARAFESQGATWIHVVDLDGARTGVPRFSSGTLPVSFAVTIASFTSASSFFSSPPGRAVCAASIRRPSSACAAATPSSTPRTSLRSA